MNLDDLSIECDSIKEEIRDLKRRVQILESQEKHEESEDESQEDEVVGSIERYFKQKWYTKILYKFQDGFNFKYNTLLDSGADVNCIRQDIIPSRYFQKSSHRIHSAEGNRLEVNYKIPEVYICFEDVHIKTTFLLVENLKQNVILGTPFLSLIRPFVVTEEGIQFQIKGKEVNISFSSKLERSRLNYITEFIHSKKYINEISSSIGIISNNFYQSMTFSAGRYHEMKSYPLTKMMFGKFQEEKPRYDHWFLTLIQKIFLMQQYLEMIPPLKYKSLIQMSTWRLPMLPNGDRDCFNHNFEVSEMQQGLLNLLWQVKNKKDKAYALNGLAYYFKYMSKDPAIRERFLCIQDRLPVSQERSPKLSYSKNGKRSSKLFDQDDPDPKLLNHEICDLEKRSSKVFRSQQINTFPQDEKQNYTTETSTQSLPIKKPKAYPPNTNLAMLKRHKPDLTTFCTPYELLVPRLGFKTEQTLAILTQDVINLIWEKYQ
jgi:hypothetical protein